MTMGACPWCGYRHQVIYAMLRTVHFETDTKMKRARFQPILFDLRSAKKIEDGGLNKRILHGLQ